MYIDSNNIMGFKNKDTLNCLYTAVTRAKKNLYLIESDKKYRYVI